MRKFCLQTARRAICFRAETQKPVIRYFFFLTFHCRFLLMIMSFFSRCRRMSCFVPLTDFASNPSTCAMMSSLELKTLATHAGRHTRGSIFSRRPLHPLPPITPHDTMRRHKTPQDTEPSPAKPAAQIGRQCFSADCLVPLATLAAFLLPPIGSLFPQHVDYSS